MRGSPEKPGGLGAKFERAFVSEIVAVDVVSNTPEKAEVKDAEARKDIVNKRAGYQYLLNVSKAVQVKQNDDGSFQVGAGNATL